MDKKSAEYKEARKLRRQKRKMNAQLDEIKAAEGKLRAAGTATLLKKANANVEEGQPRAETRQQAIEMILKTEFGDGIIDAYFTMKEAPKKPTKTEEDSEDDE